MFQSTATGSRVKFCIQEQALLHTRKFANRDWVYFKFQLVRVLAWLIARIEITSAHIVTWYTMLASPVMLMLVFPFLCVHISFLRSNEFMNLCHPDTNAKPSNRDSTGERNGEVSACQDELDQVEHEVRSWHRKCYRYYTTNCKDY